MISGVHQSAFDTVKGSGQASLKYLVIVDTGVANYQQLQQGVGDKAEFLVLHPQQDGIAQITAWLQGRQIHSLQILTHGSPGQLQLGNIQLNLANLSSYATQLQQWQVTEISLYACDVAASATGQEFVHQLAAITGANVAASVSKVGHSALGGTWNLAVQTGAVTTPLLIDAETLGNYVGVLPEVVNYTTAVETITVAANGTNTNISSSAGGGTTTYSNTSDGLQINGGTTGTNTFNISGVGTGFSLDLIINGSGYTNGDVVNINANPKPNDFTIDLVQRINVASPVALTILDTPDQGDVNWTAGQDIVFNTGTSLTTTTGSTTGNINLVANAQTTKTTGINHKGIYAYSSTISSTDGTISLNGTGGNTGTDNDGVHINGTAGISTVSSVNGAISLTGQGRGGSYNRGVVISNNALVTSATGNITVNGTSAGTTSDNHGVYLVTQGVISSTGTGANAATITVIGQGSLSGTTTVNGGVRIEGANSKITSVNGAISVTGNGGNGTNANYSVYLQQILIKPATNMLR